MKASPVSCVALCFLLSTCVTSQLIGGLLGAYVGNRLFDGNPIGTLLGAGIGARLGQRFRYGYGGGYYPYGYRSYPGSFYGGYPYGGNLFGGFGIPYF